MKTIAIIEDDIPIGDMLTEILTKKAMRSFVPIPVRKRCICFRKKSPI